MYAVFDTASCINNTYYDVFNDVFIYIVRLEKEIDGADRPVLDL